MGEFHIYTSYAALTKEKSIPEAESRRVRRWTGLAESECLRLMEATPSCRVGRTLAN
jgi:hypothetical protein